MVSPVLLSLWALALAVLGTGYALALRTETVLAIQARYAESVSSPPPSEDPDHYEQTRQHRRWTFRFGGTVLLVVGSVALATAVYATFLIGSFPQ